MRIFNRLTPMDDLPNVETSPLPFTVGLTFGMVKEIKSETFAVNWGKMWINFAGRVKNFHNVNLGEILGIGLVKWREIGGYQITMLSRVDLNYSTIQLHHFFYLFKSVPFFPWGCPRPEHQTISSTQLW